MLNHTKRVKEIYENIQRTLFYIIPEKWDKLFLYSSILDEPDEEGYTGELFFYYIPKGLFKKKPVNVYEIPSKFNLDENQYMKLVQILYNKIKELRKEFQKSERKEIWTNLTMSIQNLKFTVEYDYEDLNDSQFTSYERHVIWRYKYLGIGEEQVSKKDKEILKRYKLTLNTKTLARKEHYDAGIYIQDIENVIAYSTQDYDEEQEETETEEYKKEKNRKEKAKKEKAKKEEQTKQKFKNQLLMSQEDIKKMKFEK